MGLTHTTETKKYAKPEEDQASQGSVNAPENYYASEIQHTGYDPNDRRDMQAINNSLKTTPEIIKETEQKANATIVTPKGREINRDNFSLRSLAPDVFDDMEKRENERAALAERRMKGRQTGMLLSDAFKTLVDVVGQNKGAYNTPRKAEDIPSVLNALDKLDAEHSAALQGIAGARYKAAKDALDDEYQRQMAGEKMDYLKDKDRQAQDWTKEKWTEEEEGRNNRAKEAIDAANKRAEEANKTRRAIAKSRPHTSGSGAGQQKSKTYRYSTSDADRSNANYKNIGADNEGTVTINSEHVARYKDQFVAKYNKLQEEKANAIKNGGDLVGISQKIAAMEASDAYKAAFDMSNGGVLTDAQASAILRSEFTPESYQHMRNQPYAAKPETPKTIPGEVIIKRLFNNPDIIKLQQQSQGASQPVTTTPVTTTPAKPVVQAPSQSQPSKPTAQNEPYHYHTPGLNAKPGSPEHSKAVANVATGDYRGLKPEEMQDKVMYRVSNRVKQYNSKYGKNNQSPMAKDYREKMSIEIYNELEDYWNHTPGAMNQLETIAKKKSTKDNIVTAGDLIMDIADGIANGTKNINDIL